MTFSKYRMKHGTPEEQKRERIAFFLEKGYYPLAKKGEAIRRNVPREPKAASIVLDPGTRKARKLT